MRDRDDDQPSVASSQVGDDVSVTDAPDSSRFEVTIDGEVAGFARYVRRGGRWVFVHTEIEPRFEGRGLGSRLAAGALDAARTSGEPVVPLCPFIAHFIDEHQEYRDLVDDDLLSRFGDG